MSARGRMRVEILGLSFLAIAVVVMLVSGLRPVVAERARPVSPLSMGEPRPPVSPVIFPAQDIPLRFSHVQHLVGLSKPLHCTTCHDTVEDSRSSLDRLIPGERVCARCHEIDRENARENARQNAPQNAPQNTETQVPAGQPPVACDACHLGLEQTAVPGELFVPRVDIPSPNIKFDHALHVRDDALAIACAHCHGDFVRERVGLATRAQLPTMETCLACHEERARAPGKAMLKECVTCHLADPGGVMRTSYPEGELAPTGALFGADHDALFRVSHADEAQNNTDYCGKCHKQSFCVDCHDGVIKPRDFHGNDYVNLHGVDARRNTLECDACHRSQTFCTGCHSRSGVSSDARGGSEFERANPARRFHPERWAATVRDRDHHAFEAQRNIKQCASCHREQFCVRCHGDTVDTMGIDPHPRGWAQSRRCQTLLSRNARMCLRCHVSLDDARCI